ncbi:MAG: family 2 glycosyl [Planctomycetota bacterium]|nr:MAG: family 2 glycosyl [Planctomycetota bacterium]
MTATAAGERASGQAGGHADRQKVTAYVITLNEEANIRECLKSLAWADQVLVVDSYSTDKTCDIARELGATVVQRKWNGINEQRQAGLEHCAHDWVFCLDADERVSPELKAEIPKALEKPAADGFEIPRHTWYLGRWINHCGWYPDFKMRLFRRSRGKFAGTDPHDHFALEGGPGRLKGEIQHFTYKNFAHQLRTINAFSEAASKELYDKGRRFSLLALLIKPQWKFLEVFIFKAGFLDGLAGFVIAVASAFNVFTRQVKLWERGKGHDAAGGGPA